MHVVRSSTRQGNKEVFFYLHSIFFFITDFPDKLIRYMVLSLPQVLTWLWPGTLDLLNPNI